MAQLSTEVNRPNVPSDGATVTAEIDVEPGEQDETLERHILLCVDTSGSMGGEKLEQAREGAAWVFGLLDPDDYVGIVSFDSDARVVMRPTRWGDVSREEAMDYVEKLSAGGGTDMYEGLSLSMDSLESLAFRPETDDAVRRILLLSDGKDNEHTPSDFETLARDVDEVGIRIQSAGIGGDYEEDTIRTLGTTARGEWTHLEAAGDIESFFGDAVEQAGSVVAPDARLELDAARGVEIFDVYRALPQAQDVDLDWEDNTAVVPLPDLAERERQRVVFKVQVPPRNELDEVTLADVTLTSRGETATGTLSVEYTEDNEKLAEHEESVSLDHRQTVVQTELGKGNVEAAETELERMTKVHGAETEVVRETERQTQLVKEGGRAERNRATKIVDEDRIQ